MVERLAELIAPRAGGDCRTETRAHARDYGAGKEAALATQRKRALLCCAQMECFLPLPRPERPVELEGLSARMVQDVQRRRAETKELDEVQAAVLSAYNNFRVQRACVLRDNQSRLSGAFWALRTLYDALALDPSDREVDEQAANMLAMLRSGWDIDAIPAAVREQADLVEAITMRRNGPLFEDSAPGEYR